MSMVGFEDGLAAVTGAASGAGRATALALAARVPGSPSRRVRPPNRPDHPWNQTFIDDEEIDEEEVAE